jgi:hypothetical protein
MARRTVGQEILFPVQASASSPDRRRVAASAENKIFCATGTARLLCVAFLLTAAAQAQTQSMEIVLERNEAGAWKTIEPALVLKSGDLVRFRFRATFDGYLYVINSGTSGSQSLLFPGDATGRDNRVQAGREYTIPGGGASFKVAGPAGHDVVYWLVSPVPLDGNPASALAPKPPPKTLTPRCDDTIFRARGECIDSSAGPRNVRDMGALPPAISTTAPRLQPRELVIVQDKNKSRVSSSGKLTGPIVYEFRLAHS